MFCSVLTPMRPMSCVMSGSVWCLVHYIPPWDLWPVWLLVQCDVWFSTHPHETFGLCDVRLGVPEVHAHTIHRHIAQLHPPIHLHHQLVSAQFMGFLQACKLWLTRLLQYTVTITTGICNTRLKVFFLQKSEIVLQHVYLKFISFCDSHIHVFF